MIIIEARKEDFEKIWPIFRNIVREAKTYTYPEDTSKEEGYKLWMEKPLKTYVVLEDGEVLGTYYIKANQTGRAAHICNCGYMVSKAARGKGVATKMCEHSQSEAVKLGFKAMQFNFVISTNVTALNLWKRLGFEEIGRLPKAYDHPDEGFVDAVIMYKWLID